MDTQISFAADRQDIITIKQIVNPYQRKYTTLYQYDSRK
jgi:hypothetical protein